MDKNALMSRHQTNTAAHVAEAAEKIKPVYLESAVVRGPWRCAQVNALMCKLIHKTVEDADVAAEQTSFAVGDVVQESAQLRHPPSVLEVVSAPIATRFTVERAEKPAPQENAVRVGNAFAPQERPNATGLASIYKATCETAAHAERPVKQAVCVQMEPASQPALQPHPPPAWVAALIYKIAQNTADVAA